MKIKQFINEKPRLKKAIKIIVTSVTIFFAAFGVVCSGLLIGSCANQKAKEVVATTPLYKEKPIKEALDYNGSNYVFSCSDIVNTFTFSNWFKEAGSYFSSCQVNDTLALNVYEPAYAEVGEWSNLDFDTLRFTSVYGYFNCLRFVCTQVSYLGAPNGEQTLTRRFDFQLFNTSTNTAIVTMNFRYIDGQNFASGNFSGLSGSVVNSWNVPTSQVVRVNRYDNPNLYKLLTYNEYVGYNEGYQLGYKQGDENGHTRGYNEGYQAGLEDSQGLTSNPFRLISNAFNAVAGILNIQVLPNLTLGVLIFTPLIIVIIIVVVRIIRG